MISIIRKITLSVVAVTMLVTPLSYAVTLPYSSLSAYGLYDREADTFIEGAHVDTAMGIASISKLMTIKLVLDDLAMAKYSLNSLVPISEHAVAQDGDNLKLRIGTTETVDALIHGLMICSSNDAAVALSEFSSGSEASFVNRMNLEATTLGLDQAIFTNPSGLTNYGLNHETLPHQNRMSLANVNVLADALLTKYPSLTDITKLETWTLPSKAIELKSTNKLLPLYAEVDGLKTGFTNYAGYCQIVSANLSDLTVVTNFYQKIYHTVPQTPISHSRQIFASVLGASSSTVRNETVKALVDYAKSNLIICPVTDVNQPVAYDADLKCDIVPIETKSVLIPKDATINQSVFYNPSWLAHKTSSTDSSIGKIIFYTDSGMRLEVPLVLAQSSAMNP